MSIKVAQEFLGRGGGWTCFFATTYTHEFELFDEYLFRRLGEPPVNATVLCDFNRLARRLGAVELGDGRDEGVEVVLVLGGRGEQEALGHHRAVPIAVGREVFGFIREAGEDATHGHRDVRIEGWNSHARPFSRTRPFG